MMVTKQEQLEWLAKNWCLWVHSLGDVFMSKYMVGAFVGMTNDAHQINFDEWQQERDKMQKQDNSWYERGELPPAGTVCEYVFNDNDHWFQCEIKYVVHGDGVVVKPSHLDYEQYCSSRSSAQRIKFRPLRTEREKAIDEMADLIGKSVFGSAKCQAEKLYDAGYRKQE